MKKFCIKLFILFVLLVIMIGLIIFIPLPENSYDLAIIDKHRVLAGTKSPKIVLAGGSNLAFGIDSEAIQNEFHIPVVNMGVHAGFGLGRILHDISRFLQQGDILLIIPEYDHFVNIWNGDGAAYELIILNVRQNHLLLSLYYGLPSGFSNYLYTHIVKIVKKTIDSSLFSYSRDGFNEYGDYIKHLGMTNQVFGTSASVGTINMTYINNFFKFIDDFTERGITVMLSYPCYQEGSFRNSIELIQEVDKVFKSKENLLVISTPVSYCFPTNYFFDTPYHLNIEGRSVRTKQLIEDLRASIFHPNR